MTRLIAGTAKGRRLLTPAHDRTRPTSDRVREAAFNLIADWAGTAGEPGETQLRGFSLLDLYSGSGAVALEAASRGAHPVLAVESDARVAGLIRRNVAATELDVQVTVSAVERAVAGTSTHAFDVAWLDPPYSVPNAEVETVVGRLLDHGWLAPDGLVVAERAARTAALAWPATLRRTWERRYGETVLYLASPGTL